MVNNENLELLQAFNPVISQLKPEDVRTPQVPVYPEQSHKPNPTLKPSNINIGNSGAMATGTGSNVNDVVNDGNTGGTQAEREALNSLNETTEGKSEAQLLEETRTILAHAPNKAGATFKYDIPDSDDQIWSTVIATAIPALMTIAAAGNENVDQGELMQAIGITMKASADTWLSAENKMKRADNVSYLEANGYQSEFIQKWIEDGDEIALNKSKIENPFFNKERVQTKRLEAGDKVQMADGTWETVNQTGDYEFISSFDSNGMAQLDSVSFKDSDKADRFFNAGQAMPNGSVANQSGYYSEHLVKDSNGNEELQYVLQKPYTDPLDIQNARLDAVTSKAATEAAKALTANERKRKEALAAVNLAIKTGDTAGGDHTGITDQYLFNLSEEAQIAEGAFDRAAATLTMENLDQMKGALSDADIALLKQAGSALDKGRYWDVNRVELLRIREALLRQLQGSSGLVAPPVGTVEDGYRFLGGDPSDANNWQQVGG